MQGNQGGRRRQRPDLREAESGDKEGSDWLAALFPPTKNSLFDVFLGRPHFCVLLNDGGDLLQALLGRLGQCRVAQVHAVEGPAALEAAEPHPGDGVQNRSRIIGAGGQVGGAARLQQLDEDDVGVPTSSSPARMGATLAWTKLDHWLPSKLSGAIPRCIW